MSANTYDGQTAKFIATVVTCMPPMSAEIMQGWIQNPRALKEMLAPLAPSGQAQDPDILVYRGDTFCFRLDDGSSVSIFDVSRDATEGEIKRCLWGPWINTSKLHLFSFSDAQLLHLSTAVVGPEGHLCGSSALLSDGRSNFFYGHSHILEVSCQPHPDGSKNWQATTRKFSKGLRPPIVRKGSLVFVPAAVSRM